MGSELPAPASKAVGGNAWSWSAHFDSMWAQIDVNWIDLGSIVGAVIYLLRRWYLCRKKNSPFLLISRRSAQELANGAAFFPLLILGMSIFSAKLIQELLSSNRVILSLAGLCALLALLEESQEESQD